MAKSKKEISKRDVAVDWDKIVALSEAANMSQKRLSQGLGMGDTWISNSRISKTQVTREMANRICAILGCSVEDIAKTESTSDPHFADGISVILERLDQIKGMTDMHDISTLLEMSRGIQSEVLYISEAIDGLKNASGKNAPYGNAIAYLRTRFLFHGTVSPRAIQDDIKMLQNLGVDIDMRRTQLAAAELMIDTSYSLQGDNLWKRPDTWETAKRR